MGNPETISLHVEDMSGQRQLEVDDVPIQASWGETLSAILNELSLPKNSPAGDDAIWAGRLEREGRHLNSSELVGDALQDGDRIVIQRDINAG